MGLVRTATVQPAVGAHVVAVPLGVFFSARYLPVGKNSGLTGSQRPDTFTGVWLSIMSDI